MKVPNPIEVFKGLPDSWKTMILLGFAFSFLAVWAMVLTAFYKDPLDMYELLEILRIYKKQPAL